MPHSAIVNRWPRHYSTVAATTPMRRLGAPLRGLAIGVRTQSWPAHSRLFVAGDGNEWAIADDAAEVTLLAQSLGVRVGPERWIARVRNQSVFHTSQFTLIGLPFERNGNRLGVAYLHGRPGTPGMPDFDTCYETVRRRHEELDRVQVSNRAMEELVLGTGIAPEKVFRIPIGVDPVRFHPPDAARACRGQARARAARVGVRRRLVPEGRRRLGRGARAEADQGAGRAPRRRRAARARGAGAAPPAHRARPRVRRRRARAARRPVRPGAPARPRRRRARLPRDRPLPRHLARRGRPEGRAGVDGDRRAARDDARRAGGRPRPRRRERLALRRRGRRRARRCRGPCRARPRRPHRAGRRRRARDGGDVLVGRAPPALARAARRDSWRWRSGETADAGRDRPLPAGPRRDRRLLRPPAAAGARAIRSRAGWSSSSACRPSSRTVRATSTSSTSARARSRPTSRT